MPAEKSPSVSFLIPTYNRSNSLEKAIASLAAMEDAGGGFEVVVIDDGSTDGTDALVAGLRERVPFALVYARQHRRGIPSARNAGIRLSKGDILVFTDDDCQFPRHWLQRLGRHFATPNLGAVGVPDRNPTDGPFLSRCVDYAVNSLVGSGGVREKTGARLARYFPRGFGMAVPRKVIEDVGPFDETMKAGEDIDLSYRIWKAGYAVIHEPDAFVWHDRRSSLSGFLRQMFTRGATRIDLVRRHRGLLEPAYFLPAAMVAGFAVLVCASFFVPFAGRVLTVLAGLYALAIAASGVAGARRIRDLRAVPVIPILLGIQHLMYGLGTLKALVLPGERPGPGRDPEGEEGGC